MAEPRTSIYNLTDVTERPETLTLFNCPIAPGGRLVLPKSRLTQVEMGRLSRMVTTRMIGVGDNPPPWYVQEKEDRRRFMQAKQAGLEVDVPEKVEPPKALFDLEEVMDLLGKAAKADILKFSGYMRPEPVLSAKMKKDDLLDAIEAALGTGTKIIPLADAMDLIKG
jgi:hypothetical protein